MFYIKKQASRVCFLIPFFGFITRLRFNDPIRVISMYNTVMTHRMTVGNVDWGTNRTFRNKVSNLISVLPYGPPYALSRWICRVKFCVFEYNVLCVQILEKVKNNFQQ